MSIEIDMDRVTSDTVQQLGSQLALLTLELNAQRAAGAAMQARIEELESQLTDADGEKLPGAFRAPDEVSI